MHSDCNIAGSVLVPVLVAVGFWSVCVCVGGRGGGCLSERVSMKQLGNPGACYPAKVLNLSLLKWLGMHQKLSTFM